MHHEPDNTQPTTPDLATQRRAMLAGVAGLAAGAFLTSRAGAGDLNPPPGPISPTMKPLDQIEPRIPINSTNTPGNSSNLFRITQPGSYYLTGNLQGVFGRNGISIEADNVCIDLMGFALLGALGSQTGIRVDNRRNDLIIRNGTISGWGVDGINLVTINLVSGFNCIIESMTASDNGGDGIRASNNTSIRGCVMYRNTGSGISAQSGSVISGCAARGNSSHGITVGTGSMVVGCNAYLNGGNGIQATFGCAILDNMSGTNNAGTAAGIRVSSSNNRIEGNNCTDNIRGIECTSGGNFIARNTCRGNGTNWVIAANNKCLVINGTNAPAINGDSGGTSPGSTNPNANYTY